MNMKFCARNRSDGSCGKGSCGERGAAAVEFALVAPVLFALIFLVIDLCVAMSARAEAPMVVEDTISGSVAVAYGQGDWTNYRVGVTRDLDYVFDSGTWTADRILLADKTKWGSVSGKPQKNSCSTYEGTNHAYASGTLWLSKKNTSGLFTRNTMTNLAYFTLASFCEW